MSAYRDWINARHLGMSIHGICTIRKTEGATLGRIFMPVTDIFETPEQKGGICVVGIGRG
jgi:hypothetical protein